jgi:superoxide dismutase, Cu-Zn family
MRITNTPGPRLLAVAAALATALSVGSSAALPTTSHAHQFAAVTTLRAADGTVLGRVHFFVKGDKTVVHARLNMPSSIVTSDAFHGFHVHANSDPANGEGCVADPNAASTTWFTSADGHLTDVENPTAHGAHPGDMPSLLVNADGTADLIFTTQRLEVSQLDDRVVIVHAGADNFNNVPLGAGADQYTANSPTATDKTKATGNAGDRVGCGVISIGGW